MVGDDGCAFRMRWTTGVAIRQLPARPWTVSRCLFRETNPSAEQWHMSHVPVTAHPWRQVVRKQQWYPESPCKSNTITLKIYENYYTISVWTWGWEISGNLTVVLPVKTSFPFCRIRNSCRRSPTSGSSIRPTLSQSTSLMIHLRHIFQVVSSLQDFRPKSCMNF